jgi:hypothetical protein
MAMQYVYDFLFDVNQLLLGKDLHRMDDMLRPAAMSGMHLDMLTASMAKHSRTLFENRQFNGHPDLIVQRRYPQNSVRAGEHGIEIKSTRTSGEAVAWCRANGRAPTSSGCSGIAKQGANDLRRNLVLAGHSLLTMVMRMPEPPSDRLLL